MSSYNTTEAFATRVPRIPDTDRVLDKLKWQVFPGDELHATVYCQGREQFEMVRAKLADAQIILTAYDTEDWSLTVKKSDLQIRFPGLFQGHAR